MSYGHYSHSTDSNTEAQRGLDNLQEGFKQVGDLIEESSMDHLVIFPRWNSKVQRTGAIEVTPAR